MMRIISSIAAVVGAILFLSFTKCFSQELIGKVIDSYVQRDTTHCTIEVRKPLVSGKNISLSNGITVVIGERLGERGGIYYYSVSAVEKPKIPVGTDVFNEEIKSFINKNQMFMRLERKSTFAPKKYGEVTAVQNKRALVDKGSLHEVRERDLYAIYDSNGKYKGKVEMRGVGDFQSSGKVYQSLESFGKETVVEAGDRVKYLGQRKLFGLGFIGGSKELRHRKEMSYGGGLLWNLTFPDGWGVEMLFGGFYTRLKTADGILYVNPKDFVSNGDYYIKVYSDDGLFLGYARNGESYEMLTIAPVLLKKNFFYPQAISPFLGAGFAYFRGEYHAVKTNMRSVADVVDSYGLHNVEAKGEILDKEVSKETLAPIFSGGVTLFPGKFFQLRADAKYFLTPDMDVGFTTFKTRGFIYFFGFTTNW